MNGCQKVSLQYNVEVEYVQRGRFGSTHPPDAKWQTKAKEEGGRTNLAFERLDLCTNPPNQGDSNDPSWFQGVQQLLLTEKVKYPWRLACGDQCRKPHQELFDQRLYSARKGLPCCFWSLPCLPTALIVWSLFGIGELFVIGSIWWRTWWRCNGIISWIYNRREFKPCLHSNPKNCWNGFRIPSLAVEGRVKLN